MTTKTTAKSITESEIRSLRDASGQAGDFRQVGLCDLALTGEIEFDDYTVFDAADRRWLEQCTQESALNACVEAIGDGHLADECIADLPSEEV